MHNFKIACANLKDPNISSLRMNHFKIAHISTWLATRSLIILLEKATSLALVIFESAKAVLNISVSKLFSVLLG